MTTTMGPGIRIDPSRTRRGEIMQGAGASDGAEDSEQPAEAEETQKAATA